MCVINFHSDISDKMISRLVVSSKLYIKPAASFAYQRRTVTTEHAVSPLLDMFGSAWSTKVCEQVLLFTHDTLHAPWSLSLFGIAMAAKLLTSPIILYAIKSSVKLNVVEELIKPHLVKMVQDIKVEGARRNIPEEKLKRFIKEAVKKAKDEVYEKNNVSPFKAIALGVLQLPVWLSVTLAVRNIALSSRNSQLFFFEQHRLLSDIPHEDFAQSGFLWINSFATPDPTFTLPILLFFFNMALTQLKRSEFVVFGVPENVDKKSRFQMKLSTGISVGFTCLVALAACWLPSGVAFYWVISSLLHFCFTLLLKYQKPRNFFNIPMTRKELSNKAPLKTFLKSLSVTVLRRKV